LGQAIERSPDSAVAHNNLGIALSNLGFLDQAIFVCRRAVELQPESADAHNRLANALVDKGEFAEAIASYRKALSLSPDFILAHHNLLLAMNYHPDTNAVDVLRESRRWNLQHAQALVKSISPHQNSPDPHRRLRIGYVSADFREHPVGRFILPVLASHDRSQFELFCYSESRVSDQLTTTLKAHVDHWRSIAGESDELAAQLIRKDSIDILIDLAGHTPGNRLMLFAHKPAPIQITYLGYPATTGMTVMDYRLTDALADPPGITDSFCSEKLIRLPSTAWCFRAPDDIPDVTELPCKSRGSITFGNFNSIFKLNDPLLALWAKVLNAVPNSRLLLKARGLEYPSLQQKIWWMMSEAGIEAERVDLRGRVSLAAHLELYRDIDIALDSYPYHGTTTTCESLFMGVPVVTLAGQSHVSRVGVSLVSSVGLADLVAKSPQEYVDIAASLAHDIPQLTELHHSLRPGMKASPLMNETLFTSNLESAYRSAWHTWCETQS